MNNSINNFDKKILQIISEHLTCPISHTLLDDAVLMNDNIIYNKNEIKKHLLYSDKSPLTKEKIYYNSKIKIDIINKLANVCKKYNNECNNNNDNNNKNEIIKLLIHDDIHKIMYHNKINLNEIIDNKKYYDVIENFLNNEKCNEMYKIHFLNIIFNENNHDINQFIFKILFQANNIALLIYIFKREEIYNYKIETHWIFQLIMNKFYNILFELIQREKNCNDIFIGLCMKNKLENEEIKMIDLLFEKNIKINEINYIDYYPIHYICLNNNVDMLKIIIEKNIPINLEKKSIDGLTPLQLLCKSNIFYIKLLKILLDKNINTNYNKQMINPILHFCYSNNEKYVKLLIEYNIDLNQVDVNNNSVLSNVENNNIIDIIFKSNYNLYFEKNILNNTPIHNIFLYANLDNILFLLKKDKSCKYFANVYKITPIHNLFLNKNIFINNVSNINNLCHVLKCIDKKDLNNVDIHGDTPVNYLFYNPLFGKNKKITKILLKHLFSKKYNFMKLNNNKSTILFNLNNNNMLYFIMKHIDKNMIIDYNHKNIFDENMIENYLSNKIPYNEKNNVKIIKFFMRKKSKLTKNVLNITLSNSIDLSMINFFLRIETVFKINNDNINHLLNNTELISNNGDFYVYVLKKYNINQLTLNFPINNLIKFQNKTITYKLLSLIDIKEILTYPEFMLSLYISSDLNLFFDFVFKNKIDINQLHINNEPLLIKLIQYLNYIPQSEYNLIEKNFIKIINTNNAEITNKQNYKLIHYSCKYNLQNLIKYLVSLNVDLECVTFHNWKPIHVISYYGKYENIKYFLNLNVDKNSNIKLFNGKHKKLNIKKLIKINASLLEVEKSILLNGLS